MSIYTKPGIVEGKSPTAVGGGRKIEPLPSGLSLKEIVANLPQMQNEMQRGGKRLIDLGGGRVEAMAIMTRWIANPKPRLSLTLRGPIGTGKSTLMDALMVAAADTTKAMDVTAMREVGDEYEKNGADCFDKYKARHVTKQGWGADGKYYTRAVLNHWIMNDLGREKDDVRDYGNKENVGRRFLDFRYDLWQRYGLLTHFTTNSTDEQLKFRYGDMLYGRLKEMTYFIEVEGVSLRPKK